MLTGVGVSVGSGIGVSVSAGAKVGVPVQVCVGFGVSVSVDVHVGFRVGVTLSFVGFSVGLPFSFVGASVGFSVGSAVDYDLQLVLSRTEVPALILGSTEAPPYLGQTTWLVGRTPERDMDDAILASGPGPSQHAKRSPGALAA